MTQQFETVHECEAKLAELRQQLSDYQEQAEIARAGIRGCLAEMQEVEDRRCDLFDDEVDGAERTR